MKLLFLIFIFVLGVNAQTEQIGPDMPKLLGELSKNYEKEISCVGQVFSDPTLGAKLSKIQTQFEESRQKFSEVLAKAYLRTDVCSKCYKDICSNFTAVAEQFVDEIKTNVKPCFPKSTFIDMIDRFIKKSNKFLCSLELEEIIEMMSAQQKDCVKIDEKCKEIILGKEKTEFDYKKMLTDFCGIDFSGFLECARKPLSTCVGESHALIKSVDFLRSFVDEECKPLTSGGSQVAVLSPVVAICLFLIQKI